jgi:predicted metallopeptidase
VKEEYSRQHDALEQEMTQLNRKLTKATAQRKVSVAIFGLRHFIFNISGGQRANDSRKHGSHLRNK